MFVQQWSLGAKVAGCVDSKGFCWVIQPKDNPLLQMSDAVQIQCKLSGANPRFILTPKVENLTKELR